MRLQLAHVTPRRDRLKSAPTQILAEEYVARAQRLAPVALQTFRTEDELLGAATRRSGRTVPYVVLLDSRGRTRSSPDFAELIRGQRDSGTQEMVLAVGPADGWSSGARDSAQFLLSLSAMTLPHELALVVLAEQTYRALTILAGHPYHSGHE